MNIYNEIEKVSFKHMKKTAMVLWQTKGNNVEVTYENMMQQVSSFSTVLHQIGLEAGSRVAIVAESTPEWVYAYLAILKNKSTAVLLDASLPKEELNVLLKKSKVSAIYASVTQLDKVIENEDTPILNVSNGGGRVNQKRCVENELPGDEKIATIIFSSGTTKLASGIMHGHDGIIGSSLMCVNNNGVDGSDRFFGILPNSHIYGLYTQVIAPLILGGSVCFIESLDAACLLGALQGYKPTVFPAVPKVFELLKTNIMKKIEASKATKKMFDTFFPICLKKRKTSGINLGKRVFGSIHKGFGGKMKIMASAGAPMDVKTAEFYYGVGFNMLITYGATETSIPTIGNYGDHITVDSCGKPYPEVAIKLDDSGEILIKSPYMMLGYFDDAQATKNAFTVDGWFKTGDLGSIDENGDVHINGRCKDNIVLATGKKIAPDDIETAYDGILGVKELVICGIADEEGGHDHVHAFVVADQDEEATIRERIRERGRTLSQNMKLREIHFVPEIPKTSLQKPKRYLLKKAISHKVKKEVEEAKKEQLTLEEFLIRAIAKVAQVNEQEVTKETRLFEELTIDSLSSIELALEIEEYAGVNVTGHLTKEMTVAELITLVESGNVTQQQQIDPKRYPLEKKGLHYGVFAFHRFLVGFVYKVKIHNYHVIPKEQGYILCSNHVTNFDYLILTQKFKKKEFYKFGCMAKQELFKDKWVHRLLVHTAGMIPVDRSGNASVAMKAVEGKLKEDWGILIHPEGTRSKDGIMGEYKKGAAVLAIESGVPIIPAYIKGGHEIFPPGQSMPTLFNIKKCRRYTLEVVYGEPISPENMTPEELMEKVVSETKKLAN
ncbi:MAG: AMP-binding protein [bacterium]|nr:AMP-binding protein [bacterium]